MTFHDRRNEPRPTSGEAPFFLNEVFYSRTDNRGVIVSGNYVFRRVSDYDWSELVGAPHKIIRHPDMPRGVFHLFWEHLNQGRSVGAYVKNETKDGLYYWVFAIAMPFGGGFLSARIKPTSEVFSKIEAEYASLRTAEIEDGLSPEDSAQRLNERLKDMGYDSYDQFAAIALSKELSTRDMALTGTPDPRLAIAQSIFDTSRNMTAETAALIHDFEGMQTIPYNLRVIASRLEPTGGPISTLSQNYGSMSREMSTWFEQNVLGPECEFATIGETVTTSLHLTGMVRVLKECEVQAKIERRKLGHQGPEDEHAQLVKVADQYQDLAKEGLARVRTETKRIIDACQIMNRHVLGLSSTRVMCKIESARLPEGGEGLAEIIHQLKLFQDRVADRLETLEAMARSVSIARF